MATETIDVVGKDAIEALRRIKYVRDFNAENGHYPDGYMGPDQCFDDWAADIADTILARLL